MTGPTQEVKNEMEFTYSVDQQVSVNAFIDVDVNGEAVKFQITSRYNSTPEKIVKTTKAAIDAFAQLRTEYQRPVNAAPAKSTPAATEAGGQKKFEVRPVPDAEKPEGLPEGIEVYKDDFDYFEITPQPDNKATVAFFKDGLQWPVGAKINKWKHKDVATILAPLGEFDPSKAQKPRVAGSQYWSKGAPYTIASGAHAGEQSNYKDIRIVTANF